MVDAEPTDTCGCEMFLDDEEYVCGCRHCPRCDEWISKEQMTHSNGEFPSSGVCGECTCTDCGVRIDNDDLEDMWCVSCYDKKTNQKDKRTAEGWCYDCDEEMAVEMYVDPDNGGNMPLCLACLGQHRQTDRAWQVFIEKFGRKPSMGEYLEFGLQLEDDDFQDSLPKGLE